MSGDSSEEKALPASARKLDEARKKGQVEHSKEIVNAAVTLAALAVLLTAVPNAVAHLGQAVAAIPQFYQMPLADGFKQVCQQLAVHLLWLMAPLTGCVIAVIVLVNIVLHRGLLFSLDPIIPKFERIHPGEGLKRVFGLKSWIELLKSLAKLGVVTMLTTLLLRGAAQALADAPACGPQCVPPLIGLLLKRQIIIMGLFMLAMGIFDIAIQKWLFMRDMRMTFTEQKRENKDIHGNPLIRREHQRHRREATSKRGMAHATFAVRSTSELLAFCYGTLDAQVPLLVARGQGERSHLLMTEARKRGLPMVFNPIAVQELAPMVRLGQPIPNETFTTVIACMREAGVL